MNPRRTVALVVAGQGDFTSDAIGDALAEAGAEVARLDPAATPLRMDCVHGGGWCGTVQTGDGDTVNLDRVGAVLWRWPVTRALPGHPAIADPGNREWAAREDREALMGVLRSLPAYWMSHPDRIAAVDSKPVQLRDAARAGLATPPTLIATHGDAAARWMTPDTPHIYKAFRAVHRPAHGEPGVVYAQRVEDQPAGELLAASQFQRLVSGAPLRVTVIGDLMFAATIEGDYDVDWRALQPEDAHLRPVDVPDRIRKAITELMRGWQLTYGAFDFIGDVFLEVNPLGTFGFVERATGQSIAQAVAATLISNCGREGDVGA